MAKQAKKTKKKTKKRVKTKARSAKAEVVEELKPAKRSSKSLTRGPTSTAPADPLLSAYMREVSRYPLLSREEEKELAIKFFETGDKEAFQSLVTSNLRFVVKIAYEYVFYRAKLLDLIQEGNAGLLKAVKEFNPYKDVRLTTYAVWWIRSYIQDSILKNYSLVKMGTTRAQKKLFYRLRAEQKKLEKMGIGPGQQQVKLLAERLDVREKDVNDMDQRLSGRDLSLNAPVSEGEGKSHIQFLADDQESVDTQVGEDEQRLHFKKVLKDFAKTLEGREKVFFQDRLISEKPATLQELGERYGVSKERARQIESQIKSKLKEYVQTNFPDFDILVSS